MTPDTSVDREIEERPWHEALLSLSVWRRRAVFVFAAGATGAAALFFTLADRSSVTFRKFLLEGEPLWGFRLEPVAGTVIAMGLAIGGMWLVMTLRDRYFQGTQGTGIPQVMASLDVDADDPRFLARLDISIGVGDRFKRICSIDHGAKFAGLHPSFQPIGKLGDVQRYWKEDPVAPGDRRPDREPSVLPPGSKSVAA